MAEAYQRLFHIVKQTRPGRCGGFLTRDKDVVRPAHPVNRQKRPRGFTQATPGAVADDRVADLLGGGEACAGLGPRKGPAAGLDDDQAAPFCKTCGHKQEFAPHTEAQDIDL